MSFYSDQAGHFEDLAADIQTRLTNQGATLDDAGYANLEAQRDALLDKATQMILADVQATLAQLKVDQPRLAQCTKSLVQAAKNVKAFDQYAAIISAAVALATAIASADLGGIASGIVGAEQAIAAVVKPQDASTTPAKA
jgi:hypothetical protein